MTIRVPGRSCAFRQCSISDTALLVVDRVDPGDRGGEYRSLLGLPGGTKHTSYPLVEEAATKAGFKLVAGKGNDPDTFGKQIVFVYDTAKFPFYQAEVYHQVSRSNCYLCDFRCWILPYPSTLHFGQYHNDFQSPAYGKEYNQLVNVALEDGRIKGTGCPDRI